MLVGWTAVLGHPIARLVLVVALVVACGGVVESDDAIEPTTVAPTLAGSDSTPTTPPTTSTTSLPTETTSTTLLDPDRLLGTWLVVSANILVKFNEDGTHDVSYLAGRPFESGPYVIEGDQITFLMSPEMSPDPACGPEPGIYTVAVSEDGDALHFTWISDQCGGRLDILEGLVRYELTDS